MGVVARTWRVQLISVGEASVVETWLPLREELHLTHWQTDAHEPVPVTLRREDVTIERVDRERHEPHSQGQEESHGEDCNRTL